MIRGAEDYYLYYIRVLKSVTILHIYIPTSKVWINILNKQGGNAKNIRNRFVLKLQKWVFPARSSPIRKPECCTGESAKMN